MIENICIIILSLFLFSLISIGDDREHLYYHSLFISFFSHLNRR
ncbi:hypothetical protein CRE_08169 [Caenorhabditis remanei]|uniref:Uncharacterized protein n=1 Tax=Caenorhabditis remanei TaxID=31234 RepID=E3M3T3_CAERE|nr:hypothetical protein CRE_08169 [Caenorhabditis remanei]